jgi:hypothetical protein
MTAASRFSILLFMSISYTKAGRTSSLGLRPLAETMAASGQPRTIPDDLVRLEIQKKNATALAVTVRTKDLAVAATLAA